MLTTTAVYQISYTDFPADFPVDLERDASIRKQFFNRLRDVVVARTNSKVLSEEDMTIEGHPGRMTKLAIANGGISRIKICAVGKRIYHFQVVTPKETLAPDGGKFDQTRADKFLDSFKLALSGNEEKSQ